MGSVNDVPFVLVDAVAEYPTVYPPTEDPPQIVLIHVASVTGLCAKENMTMPGVPLELAAIVLETVSKGTSAAPRTAGDFPIATPRATLTDGNWSGATTVSFDATGHVVPPQVTAVSGNVHVDQIDDSEVDGSAELKMQSGDSLTIRFRAPFCDLPATGAKW